MSALLPRLRTLWALGPANLVRVGLYRTGLRLGIHPAQRIRAPECPPGPYFSPPGVTLPLPVPDRWKGDALLFGRYRRPIGDAPPDWMAEPLADEPSPPDTNIAATPWWNIPDFAHGDIKRIWEYSRLDWTLAFAQQARAGDYGAFERLECWLEDWVARNPGYCGANWKCAQEASIRLLHLATAALLLGTEGHMTAAMRSLVDTHVRRILPTLSYARAQDNNHATSEAGALFVAGAWLRAAGQPGADALLRHGRALVEKSTLRLFAEDGSFSQHSTNYHRLALDTLSLVEVWRRRAGDSPFSAAWIARSRAATDWLRIMTDPVSGETPNLGANDGANLLPLTDAAYRDFRMSVQIACALFAEHRAFPPGPWDAAAAWLGVALPSVVEPLPAKAIFPDGGYAVLRHGEAMAMLRFPRFRFRPSQADALHLDLWHHGENLLRDGGTFSYNTSSEWIEYFGGVASHNTVQFDNAPQMPRISRFLLGDWLDTETSGITPDGFAACYRSREGWRHRRSIALGDHLIVTDDLSGFKRQAALRWRLTPGNWLLEGNAVSVGRCRLTVRSEVPLSLALVQGWESRHYLEKTCLPVLEATITRPGRITSAYHWAP